MTTAVRGATMMGEIGLYCPKPLQVLDAHLRAGGNMHRLDGDVRFDGRAVSIFIGWSDKSISPALTA